MGSMMAQLFVEEGGHVVSIYDVKGENVDACSSLADKNPNVKGKVHGFKDLDPFMRSLENSSSGDSGRLFMFSITHGNPADSVLDHLGHYLKEGDIVMDGGNEWYENSQRRAKELHEKKGVLYVDTGVSGGYQSARRGPSFSPGGDDATLDKVLPLLQKVAAKDGSGNPCVLKMGPSGAGHHIKMVHNGIEQGMMSALCEAWGLLHFKHQLDFDEIGDIFEKWNNDGELRNNFVVNIGSDINKRRDPEDQSKHLLSEVMDKVVQDADDTEGTGYWTIMEAARNHVSAPTIADAHFMRIASSNRKEHMDVSKHLNIPMKNSSTMPSIKDKPTFIKHVRRTTYATFLASFVQGLHLLARQSVNAHWNIDLEKCIKLWRAGCIIQSEFISDLLQPVVDGKDEDVLNLLEFEAVAKEFERTFESSREVVGLGVRYDAYLPSISSTFSWINYIACDHLPTQFMEAELDYSGAHMFDKWGEGPGQPTAGNHHFEWKPA